MHLGSIKRFHLQLHFSLHLSFIPLVYYFHMTTQIVILGYGEIGKALHGILLPQPNLTISCWDKNSDILPHQSTLANIIPTCDVLFACVPTWTTRSALQEIRSFLNPRTIVVSLSKGFEKETCQRVDTLFPQNLPNHNPFVFLGGSMIAEEIVAGLAAIGVAASESKEASQTVASLFKNTSLVVSQSKDLTGVVLAASCKNIYALGLGICDGLNMGSNIHGALVSQAAQEMMNIISKIGGISETALGPAGLGDLVATSQSVNSTNYTTGIRFAQGLAPTRGSEALNTIPCIVKIPNINLKELPFLKAIYNIVVLKMPVKNEFIDVLLSLE